MRPICLRRQNRLFFWSMRILPWILVLGMEIGQRGGLLETLYWISHYPLNFLLYLVIAYAATGWISLVTGNPVYPLFLLVIPLTAAGFISGIKVQMREVPVLPWNILLLGNIRSVLELIGELAGPILAGAVIYLAALLAALWRSKKFRAGIPAGTRLKYSLVPFAVLIISTASVFYVNNQGNILQTYLERGFLPAFLSQVGRPFMEKPEGYGKQQVWEALEGSVLVDAAGNFSSQGQSAADPANCYPDVIIVMAEAFSDPYAMKNLTYSSDPVPNYNRLKQVYTSGGLRVNAYGGNTSCTEFEVLTGLSSSLMIPEISGYLDVLKKGIPSLPGSLKALNYECIGIHPFHADTLGRENAYPLLGFDDFITLEDFDPASVKGLYTSDQAVGDKIRQIYEDHMTRTEDPLFLFAVTIQNHYDYKSIWYASDRQIEIGIPSSIQGKTRDMLDGYIQGLHDSDKLLGQLTDYLKTLERPAVLVFFGDHLPGLAGGMESYAQAGLIDSYQKSPLIAAGMSPGVSVSDLEKLHTTPFLILDNFTSFSRHPGTVSPCYIPALLRDLYGLPLGPYMDFLERMREKLPDLGLSSWPVDGKTRDLDAWKRFSMVQYDIMYGENHLNGGD